MFFIIQALPNETPPNTALFVTAIGAMASLIIALLVYIRTIHNKNTDNLIQITKDQAKTTSDVTNALENNTKSMEDIHEFIRNLQRK